MFKDYIFLLGGYDLEMMEIKKLLQEQRLKYIDHKLAWGAGLSDYLAVLDDIHTFVGIELILDCDPPKKYIDIDHHNEKYTLKSSLEQIASLLGIALNRYQKLIAINDSSYISGMLSMGATTEEIITIRKADRRAQGVNDKDESLAEQSIRLHKETLDGIIFIDALTTKFSAITDRLYPYDKLYISADDHFLYLGKGIETLSHEFHDQVKTRKMFYGGGKNGFIGSAPGMYNHEELDNIKNIIMQTVKEL